MIGIIICFLFNLMQKTILLILAHTKKLLICSLVTLVAICKISHCKIGYMHNCIDKRIEINNYKKPCNIYFCKPIEVKKKK